MCWPGGSLDPCPAALPPPLQTSSKCGSADLLWLSAAAARRGQQAQQAQHARPAVMARPVPPLSVPRPAAAAAVAARAVPPRAAMRATAADATTACGDVEEDSGGVQGAFASGEGGGGGSRSGRSSLAHAHARAAAGARAGGAPPARCRLLNRVCHPGCPSGRGAGRGGSCCRVPATCLFASGSEPPRSSCVRKGSLRRKHAILSCSPDGHTRTLPWGNTRKATQRAGARLKRERAAGGAMQSTGTLRLGSQSRRHALLSG